MRHLSIFAQTNSASKEMQNSFLSTFHPSPWAFYSVPILSTSMFCYNFRNYHWLKHILKSKTLTFQNVTLSFRWGNCRCEYLGEGQVRKAWPFGLTATLSN